MLEKDETNIDFKKYILISSATNKLLILKKKYLPKGNIYKHNIIKSKKEERNLNDKSELGLYLLILFKKPIYPSSRPNLLKSIDEIF